jgi:hypothetical protein
MTPAELEDALAKHTTATGQAPKTVRVHPKSLAEYNRLTDFTITAPDELADLPGFVRLLPDAAVPEGRIEVA